VERSADATLHYVHDRCCSLRNTVQDGKDEAAVNASAIAPSKIGQSDEGYGFAAPRPRTRAAIASRLIEALLAAQSGRVLVITGRARTSYFARWGFRPVEIEHAPAVIRLNYYAGVIGRPPVLSAATPACEPPRDTQPLTSVTRGCAGYPW
jgi:hypothetical protein